MRGGVLAIHTVFDIEKHLLIHRGNLAQGRGLRLSQRAGNDGVDRFLFAQALPLPRGSCGNLVVGELGEEEPRAKYSIGPAFGVLQGGYPILECSPV